MNRADLDYQSSEKQQPIGSKKSNMQARPPKNPQHVGQQTFN